MRDKKKFCELRTSMLSEYLLLILLKKMKCAFISIILNLPI